MINRRQQHVRRAIGFGAIVVLLLGAGALLVRVSRPPSPEGRDHADANARSEPVSEGRSDGEDGGHVVGAGGARPTSVSQDETGAVTAAVAYTAASQRWLYLSDEEIADEVTEIATPQSARSLADETTDDVGAARDELSQSSGRVWWLVHPLAWRVESYSVDEASVAVWAVTVLSASDVALPQSEWMTVTVDLEWLDGSWRVDAVHDRPGPTPMTGPHDEPWDAEPFDDALEGFTRLSGVSVS